LAKLDDRARLKIPVQYLDILVQKYGGKLYLTSVNGDHALVYPLSVWTAIEEKIEQMSVRDPDVEEYVSRISYWGSENELDSKGRILIPADLRDSSALTEGEILVLGKIDHLVIWNRIRFQSRYLGGDFHDERLHKVSRLINELSPYSGDE